MAAFLETAASAGSDLSNYGITSRFFVTCVTYRRTQWLATEQTHTAFHQFAERAAKDFGIAVGQYILLPDHLHFFVSGGPDFVIGRWVGQLKQTIGKSHPEPRPEHLWQEGFFDHLLRNDESLAQKWDYVRENPVQAGLVEKIEDWPFQGCVVDIDRATE